jgi:hypothetical protein
MDTIETNSFPVFRGKKTDMLLPSVLEKWRERNITDSAKNIVARADLFIEAIDYNPIDVFKQFGNFVAEFKVAQMHLSVYDVLPEDVADYLYQAKLDLIAAGMSATDRVNDAIRRSNEMERNQLLSDFFEKVKPMIESFKKFFEDAGRIMNKQRNDLKEMQNVH